MKLVLFLAVCHATYVYKKPDGQTYDVKGCEILKGVPKGTPEQIKCMEEEGILNSWPKYVNGAISSNVARTNEVLCRGQRGICKAKFEYMTDLDQGCRAMVSGCRSALRHLHEMMYKAQESEQVCNNFALKSVRGFFHDYMTTDIEGSVLSENHLDMNVGLCRWSQYINVLSDHTGCDAGSIIQMGGYLGFESCGVMLHDYDIDVKPYVHLNGGMSCTNRSTGKTSAPKKPSDPLFDEVTGQRLEKFADISVSAVSAVQEEFWCAVNPHACATGTNARNDGKSDGEAEYSGDATAVAHVIGRVTCPVHGKDFHGKTPKITPGFFHLPRADYTRGTGMVALINRVAEGYNRLRDTQCGQSADYPGEPTSDGKVPTGGVRLNTTRWPLLPGETNLNTVGGLCGMPTQFLKTVRVGGRHRVPRFMNIAAESRYGQHTDFQKQQCTDRNRKLYIPLELLTLRDEVPLPTSKALERFLAIAWDGVGTVESAWDSCIIGCDINVTANRICGGEGLQDFAWVESQPGGSPGSPSTNEGGSTNSDGSPGSTPTNEGGSTNAAEPDEATSKATTLCSIATVIFSVIASFLVEF